MSDTGMPPIEQTLAEAWFDRAARALIEHETAKKAPGLFKPEWTDRAAADYETADTHAMRWAG